MSGDDEKGTMTWKEKRENFDQVGNAFVGAKGPQAPQAWISRAVAGNSDYLMESPEIANISHSIEGCVARGR